jgi:hypothetical protein
MRKKSRGDSWKIQRDLGEAPRYPNWESRENTRRGKEDTGDSQKMQKDLEEIQKDLARGIQGNSVRYCTYRNLKIL